MGQILPSICPLCEAQPLMLLLDLPEHDEAVRCICPECGTTWDVMALRDEDPPKN